MSICKQVGLIVFAAAVCQATSFVVTPTVTPTAGGYTYSYSISLTPSGGEQIFEFDLTSLAGLSPDPSLIASPPNWTSILDATDGTVSWISNDPTDDITGPALSGFSLFSSQAPGISPLALQFEDSGGNTLFTLDDSTTGPTPIPEPGTLFAIPALALVLFSGRRRSWLAVLATAAGLSAAPNVVVQVKGAPAWAPDISIRAGQVAQLDASGSTGTGTLIFAWSQVSGPNTLRWTNKTTSQPSISASIFGEYVVSVTVTDNTGSASKTLTFGAVPTDSYGVVTQPDPNTAFLFAPMIRWGTSQWPELDERNRALADGFAGVLANNPGFNNQDQSTALPGTMSATYLSNIITGAGTNFQTQFCGGAGNTTPLNDIRLIVWYPIPGGGGATGRRDYHIVSCDSQTQMTMLTPFYTLSGTTSNMNYSYVGCGTCWGGQSSNIEYYDIVLAYYSLYYRSGRTEYLTQARSLAQMWWNGFYLDQGRSWISGIGGGLWYPIPRIAALEGIMWWAHETNRSDVWTNLYPALDAYAATFNAGGALGDTREYADEFGALAVAARLAPNASKASSYSNAVASGLTNMWIPQINAGGYYIYPPGGVAAGTAAVTNGSTTVTLTGATLPALANLWFWVSYDNQGASGDPVAYNSLTAINSTTLQLASPYAGTTNPNAYYQIGSNVGRGTQPFFDGIAARNFELAYRATGDTRARQLVVQIANWQQNGGEQASTRGFYYARYFLSCEPIANYQLGCNFQATDPSQISQSRYLTGQIVSPLAYAYLQSPSPALLQNGDFLLSAAFGKLGGPGTDSYYVYDLDSSVANTWFKDFGFFFGVGANFSWEAARTGSTTALYVGR